MSRTRATIAFDLNNMVPGKPGKTGVVYAIYKSEDGVLQCYGIDAPPSTANVFAEGCIYHKVNATSNDVLYVNNGTFAAPSFEKVISSGNIVTELDADHMATIAGGAGPSPLLWDNSQLLDVMLDPTAGFYYFNDYMGEIDVTTTDGYVITQVTTGAISGAVDVAGGALFIDSAGNTTADDGANVQLPNCMVKPAAGVTITFEARVKVNDNSALTSQFYIGLAGIDTTLIAAGVVDDVVDKCGWFHHGATTADKMSVITARTSAEDIDADKATTVDDTYINLGFKITGLDTVEWYADGVLVHTSSVTANIANAVMCLSFVAQTEGAAKDAEMEIDWVRVLQTGGRDV